MNEQNKIQFAYKCRAFLAEQSLASLRSFGRAIGVVSPTSRKKGDLIHEIVGILTEDIRPQERSGRGAPVLDDRTDVKIVEEIERLKHEYYAPAKTDISSNKSASTRLLEELEKRQLKLVFQETPSNNSAEQRVFRGQLATLNGVSFVLPLDYMKDEEKMLLAIEFIRSYALKEGDILTCSVNKNGEVIVVTKIQEINGVSPDYFTRKAHFETADVCYPIGKIRVYNPTSSSSLTAKYMDWVVPFGRGHRGLIVAPPKTGKTNFLEKVATGVASANKDVTTLVLLLNQSPEEIGQFRKVIPADSLVYATYEDVPERQVFVAECILKRAKRLAECGQDVVLIVDSFNALAHAYNETDESSGGKMLPCGLESKTLHYIKKFFGAARCLEVGGSLTILGAVSNATGNPADDLIATELSSICNLEIRLKEDLATKRLFPAVDDDSLYVKFNETGSYGEPEVLTLLRNLHASSSNFDILSILERASSYEEFIQNLRKNF